MFGEETPEETEKIIGMEGKNPKINSVVRIPASLNGSFFSGSGLNFYPLFISLQRGDGCNNLLGKAKDMSELSKVIKDEEILDKVVMSEDTKRRTRAECNITLPHFKS